MQIRTDIFTLSQPKSGASREVEYDVKLISNAINEMNCENIEDVKLASSTTDYKPKPIRKLLLFDIETVY